MVVAHEQEVDQRDRMRAQGRPCAMKSEENEMPKSVSPSWVIDSVIGDETSLTWGAGFHDRLDVTRRRTWWVIGNANDALPEILFRQFVEATLVSVAGGGAMTVVGLETNGDRVSATKTRGYNPLSSNADFDPS